VDAERRLRWYGRAFGARVTLLRIPGIYAVIGGRPSARAPGARHAGARARGRRVHEPHPRRRLARVRGALHRGAPQRVLHVCDDTELKMGDYFDLAATL